MQAAVLAVELLLFSPLPTAALAQPTDKPSEHEHGQQERDHHADADEHIDENDSGAAVEGHNPRWSGEGPPRFNRR